MILFVAPLLAVFALIAAAFVFLAVFAFIRRSPTSANRFGLPSGTRGLVQAIRRGFTQALNIEGRASRIDFWSFAIFIAVLCCLPPLIVFWAVKSGGAWWPWSLVSLMAYPLLSPLCLTMAIRRLHDVNRSGWWLLLLLAFGYFILLYWFCQPSVAEANERAEVFA